MSSTAGDNPASLHPDELVNDVDTLRPLLEEATAGEYEILGELGRGGMAAVFLANDLALNRKVAIKTMLPQFIGGPAMVQRFKREAQMAAGLSHPHIVQIHSVKQTPRLIYFVMKFIEGRGLDSIIEQQGALDLDTTRLILQQAASALSFAHHRGVVHRDIKPANIMIDENGWAVMTDFGIAKIDDGSNLTATGTAVGTPHYMAPEQFHNQPLTGAADQYALGIVAYEMLSGRKPFDGTTLAEIIKQHLFNEPPDLKVDRPDLPATVATTITRMLAKEPSARFPDLDAAIAALGPPDPSKIDAVRGRLMSIARSSPERKPRLSVPMSPIPATRPSAPTAMMRKSAPDANQTPVRSLTPPPQPQSRPVEPYTPMPAPQTPSAAAPAAPSQPTRSSAGALPWVLVGLIVVIGLGGYFAANRWMPERIGRGSAVDRNPAMRRGVQLWKEQKSDIAELEFQTAARQMPRSAMPHIYLSRIARERGDLQLAFDEAARGAQLEPNNAVVLREVGSVLLARQDYDAARRFFVRALRVNPGDRASMGWLGCAFQRLGDTDQASRWAGRAGNGPWTGCFR